MTQPLDIKHKQGMFWDIVVRTDKDADVIWRAIQLEWDIPPATHNGEGWHIRVPYTLDIGFILTRVIQNAYGASLLKFYDPQYNCPNCHNLYQNCSCNVA